jgi:hypothetical protein
LLSKGQKTAMELSGVIAGYGALENDIINRINILTSQIEYFTLQLKERINQQSNEKMKFE